MIDAILAPRRSIGRLPAQLKIGSKTAKLATLIRSCFLFCEDYESPFEPRDVKVKQSCNPKTEYNLGIELGRGK